MAQNYGRYGQGGPGQAGPGQAGQSPSLDELFRAWVQQQQQQSAQVADVSAAPPSYPPVTSTQNFYGNQAPAYTPQVPQAAPPDARAQALALREQLRLLEEEERKMAEANNQETYDAQARLTQLIGSPVSWHDGVMRTLLYHEILLHRAGLDGQKQGQ